MILVTSNPTHIPTHSPTRALIFPPMFSPTCENNPITDTPFQIFSSLSSQNFCLYANNNYVAALNVFPIMKVNYKIKNPDLCITIQGILVQLNDC